MPGAAAAEASVEGSPESPPVAAAEARALAPALVGSIEAVARSRLLTVGADAVLVEVAGRPMRVANDARFANASSGGVDPATCRPSIAAAAVASRTRA
jgi:hypothetical protein